MPDAPRTTQLYCHACKPRPHAAAGRYHSLRASPAIHPPEMPTPLAVGIVGHAPQHALPRQRGEWRNTYALLCVFRACSLYTTICRNTRTIWFTVWSNSECKNGAYILGQSGIECSAVDVARTAGKLSCLLLPCSRYCPYSRIKQCGRGIHDETALLRGPREFLADSGAAPL